LKEGKGPVPDKWADAEVQKMIYSFDCDEEARVEFEKAKI
jgi:salicylate hydroxylase